MVQLPMDDATGRWGQYTGVQGRTTIDRDAVLDCLGWAPHQNHCHGHCHVRPHPMSLTFILPHLLIFSFSSPSNFLDNHVVPSLKFRPHPFPQKKLTLLCQYPWQYSFLPLSLKIPSPIFTSSCANFPDNTYVLSKSPSISLFCPIQLPWQTFFLLFFVCFSLPTPLTTLHPISLTTSSIDPIQSPAQYLSQPKSIANNLLININCFLSSLQQLHF